MKLLFREISGPAAPLPGAGEIYIRPSSPDLQHRRDLATLVVQQGLACLQQGAGPIEAIVVRADPTLDDLLAAALAGELLSGRSSPAGAEAFARYAALVREGLTPGAVSLEVSMQGIFKAIRTAAGNDLTVPEAGERFAADWARMARPILRAAERGQDPFTTSPFAEGSEFARERAFLAKDLGVFRQDVLRGEQWIVDIPNGPPRGRALLLRQPKSLLYANWSRSETDSGIGQPFVFLAVVDEEGKWVFSTDPVQRLQINSLADSLQAAEVAKNPGGPKDDPWFDGKPFGHTMVAAPHGGTRLSDREVRTIVRRWCHASSWVQSRIGWKAPAAAVAAVLLLGLGIGYSRNWFSPSGKGQIVGPDKRTRGLDPPEDGGDNGSGDASLAAGGNSYALFFATQTYDPQPDGKNWPPLDNPKNDVTAIGNLLQDQYGFIIKDYFQQTALEVAKDLREWHDPKKYGRDSELLVFFSGHGYFDWDKHRGYVVARDSLFAAPPDERNHTCVSLNDLNDELNKIPCRHIFLILDTCFGGTVDYGVAMASTRGGEDAVTRIGRDDYIAAKMEKQSRLFLASAGKAPALDGAPGKNHSPFAQNLLDFLSVKETNNGVVTAEMLYDNIAWLKSERPKFGALPGNDGGDFLFVRKDP